MKANKYAPPTPRQHSKPTNTGRSDLQLKSRLGTTNRHATVQDVQSWAHLAPFNAAAFTKLQESRVLAACGWAARDAKAGKAMLEQIVRQNWAAFAENCAAVRDQILTGPETSLPQMLLPSTDGGPLLQALRMALPGLAEEISQKRLCRSDFIAEGSDASASGNHASDFHIVHEQTDAQLLHRQRIDLQLVPQSAPVLLFQVASSQVEASPFYLKRLDPRGGARQVNLSSGTIIGGLGNPELMP